MKKLIVLLIAGFAMLYSCKKPGNKPDPNSFYFQCKIDGSLYVPDGCTNCSIARLLGDTTFIVFGNKGYESVSIGVLKLDKIPIQETSYTLNNNLQQSASYDNSPLVNEIFKTDAIRTGLLQLSEINKTSEIISGTFSFQAYNSTQDKIVTVTEGKFRLKYSTH